MVGIEALMDEARSLAVAAGEITMRWFRSADLQVDHKHDGTEVTAADHAAERFIREHDKYFDTASGKLPEKMRIGNRALGKSQLMEPRLAGVGMLHRRITKWQNQLPVG